MQPERDICWLHRILVEQGLAGVTVTLRPQAFISYGLARLGWLDVVEQVAAAAATATDPELDRRRRGLEFADVKGAFFASRNHTLVSGHKPYPLGYARSLPIDGSAAIMEF